MIINSNVSNILRLDNMNKIFIQANVLNQVLYDINFQFDQKFSYAICGISGTGKSTFLNIISGLEVPSSGKVFFNNIDINILNQKDKNKLHLESFGIIFQYPYLLPELSVIENIMLKGLISGFSKYDCINRAQELLDYFSLGNKATFLPKSLSGGEQQRVAIARALFLKPSFLIADEPTAHLDSKNKNEILNLFIKLKKDWSMSLIIASHDPEVFNLMDVKLELLSGKLILKN